MVCLVVVVVVVEDGREPLLHLLQRHALARRIVRHLHTSHQQARVRRDTSQQGRGREGGLDPKRGRVSDDPKRKMQDGGKGDAIVERYT